MTTGLTLGSGLSHWYPANSCLLPPSLLFVILSCSPSPSLSCRPGRVSLLRVLCPRLISPQLLLSSCYIPFCPGQQPPSGRKECYPGLLAASCCGDARHLTLGPCGTLGRFFEISGQGFKFVLVPSEKRSLC